MTGPIDRTVPADSVFDPASEGWEPDVSTPFTSLIGPIWRRREGGSFVTGMLAQPKHADLRGIVHGGVILTFADHAIGVAGFYLLPDVSQITVQLATMMVDEVRIGDFIEGRSEVVGVSSSFIFIRGILRVGRRTVASSEGIWKVVKPIG